MAYLTLSAEMEMSLIVVGVTHKFSVMWEYGIVDVSNAVYRILPVLSADAEKVAELKVFLSLESLMSNENFV